MGSDVLARLPDEVAMRAMDLFEHLLRDRVVTDPLTGLQNRAGLRHLARHVEARAARSDAPFTVFFLDLDGFRAVNDRHGHDAGDQILVTSADRLIRAVRATDVVARLGGDEFAVVAEGLEPDEAVSVARRIEQALDVPIALDDGEVVHVGASVGAARAEPGEGIGAVVERANAAMDEARAARSRQRVARSTRRSGPGSPGRTQAAGPQRTTEAAQV